MNLLSRSFFLLAFANAGYATSIESVTLMQDNGGEPGSAVATFAPSDRVQHFSIKLDGLQVGSHDFLIEFWADETVSGKNQKVTEVKTSALLANTVTANLSLPNDWPMGWYRVDVKMDGASIGSHRYVVSKPWAQQSVVSWTLYQDGNGGEGTEVEAFSPDDLVQHFEMQTDGYLKRGAKLKIVYTAVDTSEGKNLQVQAVDYAVPNDASVFNILTSYISLPNPWPAGTYQIAVFEGSRLLGKHAYEIQE